MLVLLLFHNTLACVSSAGQHAPPAVVAAAPACALLALGWSRSTFLLIRSAANLRPQLLLLPLLLLVPLLTPGQTAAPLSA
jgi:hypothetical protein